LQVELSDQWQGVKALGMWPISPNLRLLGFIHAGSGR
jgi:hypothetical protein